MEGPILKLPPLNVLVVDDSAFNRRSIAEILNGPEINIVGKAADGEEALRLTTTLRPDVITLDLEMPKMDGFTFLRILMSKMPTPVIVVSSYSQKENVFRALELGAIDFVAKPDRSADSDFTAVRAELMSKVLLARQLRRGVFIGRAPLESASGYDQASQRMGATIPPRYMIAVASSTGGPTALMQVMSRMPTLYPNAFLITQHMPDKFTRTFADRLDRRSELRITEAQDQDDVPAGTALVCPGGRCMSLDPAMTSAVPQVRVKLPAPEDRYVPSADRLFHSVARVAGPRAVGVILTGMGDDGVQGAKAIASSGGVVIAESDATAIVYGMPGAAVRAGVVTRSLALPEIAEFLAALR